MNGEQYIFNSPEPIYCSQYPLLQRVTLGSIRVCKLIFSVLAHSQFSNGRTGSQVLTNKCNLLTNVEVVENKNSLHMHQV